MPGGVWALGFVSMLMDISSEMIHALLPLFLVHTLGASTATVGLIEGIGESTASISKLYSGWLSDRIGKRKLLALIGYGLGTLSKPIFAIAPNPFWVGFARFSDRIGKGIRGAPRDALVADLAPAEMRGAAFGLRQSLDTVGAFLGPALAILLMLLTRNNIRSVFWIALVPGAACVSVLNFGVREPKHLVPGERRPIFSWSDWRLLGGPFRVVVAVGSILTLGRFSEAFLILRAQSTGLPLAWAPMTLVLMNVVYALTAYPIGAVSDRMSRRSLLGPGFAVLIVADIVLAVSRGAMSSMVGIAIWGLHMGMTQGVLSALVADTSPEELRGTAFGVFNFATGLALLLASVIAGIFWERMGPSSTFFAGACFTAAGLFVAILTLRAQTDQR